MRTRIGMLLVVAVTLFGATPGAADESPSITDPCGPEEAADRNPNNLMPEDPGVPWLDICAGDIEFLSVYDEDGEPVELRFWLEFYDAVEDRPAPARFNFRYEVDHGCRHGVHVTDNGLGEDGWTVEFTNPGCAPEMEPCPPTPLDPIEELILPGARTCSRSVDYPVVDLSPDTVVFDGNRLEVSLTLDGDLAEAAPYYAPGRVLGGPWAISWLRLTTDPAPAAFYPADQADGRPVTVPEG